MLPRFNLGHYSNSYEVIKMEQIGRILPLVDKLEIVVRSPENYTRNQSFHKELLSLLLQLPARFMNKKISIDAESTKGCLVFNIDEFFTALQAYRRELIFHEFTYTSLFNNSESC